MRKQNSTLMNPTMNPTQRHKPVERRYRFDFPGLMALCEENFVRLRGLLRAMPDGQTQLRVQVGQRQSRSLLIAIEEQHAYTTMLSLSLSPTHQVLPDVELQVRLYHDANSAEVVAMSGYQRVAVRQPYPNADMHQSDEKYQWNRFLAECLAHVREYGHVRDVLVGE